MTTFWSAIINTTILSTLLALAVSLALQSTSRRALNAATRHAIWWLVLIATLALPLAYLKLTPTHEAPQIRLTNPTNKIPAAATAITAPVATRTVTLPLEIPASKWLQPLLLIWIVTAALLLARVVLSYAALYRRTARAADAPPELRARLRASRPRTRIALSEEIAIPMAVGPFHPAILIPTRLFATMTDTDLDQVALHEAAHLARRDDYTLFAQRIIEALFALHPVVRWITRQIDLEREIACDDRAAGSPEQARSYADCLTRTVALCGGVRPSLAAANVADSRSHLSRRVELLLTNRRTAQVSLLKGRCALIAVGLIGAASLLAKTPLLFAFSTPRAPVLFDPPMLTQPAPPLLAQATQPQLQAPPTPQASAPFIEQRNIGTKQLQDRQFDEAIATFTRLIPDATDKRTKGDLYARLGEACASKGDFPAAINAMEQAVALLPANTAAITRLALLYDSQGDLVQARRNYQRAIALDSNNPLALNNLAYLLAETNGDLNMALTYARNAQRQLPNFAEVNDTIGWIYLKMGLVSDAAGAFKILTEAMPTNPVYRYHYALALFQQGDRPGAFLQCKTAEVSRPTPELEKQIRALMDKIAPHIDTMPDDFVK
jgi:beta-lactamase regulating signal transducer with metallopeptidase domain/Tfp pilus assembly protein PilF